MPQNSKSPEKPLTVRTFGIISKLKKAWILRLTTVCPTSTQNQEKLNRYPGVAQLGARVVWDHQAAGSIPVTRTKGMFQTHRNYAMGLDDLCFS